MWSISPWFPTILALLALLFASTAAYIGLRSARTATDVYARLAALSGEVSEMARRDRSTASSLAELAEVRDAIDKGNELLKRISQREVMRARRSGNLDGIASKDDLRRAAGLVAGKPAPHR